MRFLHVADVHLGYEQYHSEERAGDFAGAFLEVIRDAISRKVGAVLIAGDLFHKREISPKTLAQAAYGLRLLREEGIPAIVIEGNHDRPPSARAMSWLGYLNTVGLITLLNTPYRDSELQIDPWDDVNRHGSYVDLPDGLRVVGVRYSGASMKQVLNDLAVKLPNLPGAPRCTVLMLHTGIEGVLEKYAATITRADIEALRPHCDYVALGHIHKPFEQDGWLFNPGSLETNSISEAAWLDRGYYVVQVGADGFEAIKVLNKRRPFVRLLFDITPYTNAKELDTAVNAYLAREAKDCVVTRPVVELTIKGTWDFAPAEVDFDLIKMRAEQAFGALLVRMNQDTILPGAENVTVSGETRQEMELAVVTEMMGDVHSYRQNAPYWSAGVLRLKELALRRESDDHVIEEAQAILKGAEADA